MMPKSKIRRKNQFDRLVSEIKALGGSNAIIAQRFFAEERSLEGNGFSSLDQSARILLTLMKAVPKPFEQMTEDDLKLFFAELKPVGQYKHPDLSARTKWIYMCKIKKFFKWLYKWEDGEKEPDVARWIKNKKYRVDSPILRPEEILTEQEVLALVDAADNPRDKGLILGLFETGCRIDSEFLEMKIGQLRVQGRFASYHLKNGRENALKTEDSERTVYFVASFPYLRDWLESHPYKNNPDAFVWINVRNRGVQNRMHGNNVYNLLHKYARAMGLRKKISCHIFRHSRATDLVRKKCPITQLNRLMGWSEKATTYRRYVHLAEPDIKNTLFELDGHPDLVDHEHTARKQALKEITCWRCKSIWSPGTKFCTCGNILNAETALEYEQTKANDENATLAIFQRMTILQQEMHDVFGELEKLKKSSKIPVNPIKSQ